MRHLLAIDLCGGAGGWAVAARGLPIDVRVAVDWWPAACRTYAHNHPSTLVLRGDCRAIPVKPQGFDVVLGGIPCQWLSVLRSAGLGNPVRPEERDRERALLDSILAWTGELSPTYWALEDVVQIVGELPPFTPYHVIDSQHWSGQRRKRAYVGRFPRPEPALEGDSRTASSYMRPGPYRVHPKSLHRAVSKRRSPGNVYPVLPDEKWPTVVAVGSRHDSTYVVVDSAGRRRQIEWAEAATAQGFPEDYVFVGNATETAQMVTNAIQIDTGRAILRAICRDAGLSA